MGEDTGKTDTSTDNKDRLELSGACEPTDRQTVRQTMLLLHQDTHRNSLHLAVLACWAKNMHN